MKMYARSPLASIDTPPFNVPLVIFGGVCLVWAISTGIKEENEKSGLVQKVGMIADGFGNKDNITSAEEWKAVYNSFGLTYDNNSDPEKDLSLDQLKRYLSSNSK